jgi:hypothetical protein
MRWDSCNSGEHVDRPRSRAQRAQQHPFRDDPREMLVIGGAALPVRHTQVEAEAAAIARNMSAKPEKGERVENEAQNSGREHLREGQRVLRRRAVGERTMR